MTKRYLKYALAAVLLLMIADLAITASYKKDTKIPRKLQGEHVQIKEGLLRVSQTGVGPDVLFIHGSLGSLEDLDAVIPKLKTRYTVTTFDRIGHGYSSLAREFAGVNYNAKVVKQLIEKLKLKNVIVVAHSYGGAVALKLAVDDTPEITSYVLLAPVGYAPYPRSTLERILALRGVGLGMLYGLRPFIAPSMLKSGLIAAVSPNQDEMPENFFKFRLRMWNNTGVLHTRVQQTSFMNDELKVIAPHYDSIKRPVAILFGKKDAFPEIIRDSHRLAETIPRAKLVELDSSGHYLQFTQPAAVVKAIDSLRYAR